MQVLKGDKSAYKVIHKKYLKDWVKVHSPMDIKSKSTKFSLIDLFDKCVKYTLYFLNNFINTFKQAMPKK